MENHLLKVKNLDVHYGEAQAIWDISFKIEEGSIVALVGANGAGKSTILKAISSLINPTHGEILYIGKSITSLKPEEVVNQGISHVPEGRRLFTRLTVKENLELGAFPPNARDKSNESIEKVYALFPRLSERTNQLAGTLSGGEQQMLAIGRALMSKPKLLMLDEPSLGLDPKAVQLLFDTIRVLKDSNVTILLVEQNVHQTLEIADYAYVLQTGHMKMEGKGDVLLKDPDFQKTFLGIVG